MGRRNDHSRDELERLFLSESARQLAQVGLSRFSARQVAKRVGHIIGTLYNVFGSYDRLVLAINARTLQMWAAHLRERLLACEDDRLGALVHGYFDFAIQHPRAWSASYEHQMADHGPAPDDYQAVAADLLGVVAQEIAQAVDTSNPADVLALTRSLVATVHGHCAFAVNLTFAMLGEAAPVEAALARVREAVAATGQLS